MIKSLSHFILVLALVSCSPSAEFSDREMDRYVQAHKEIDKLKPEIQNALNSGKQLLKEGGEKLTQLEQAVKKAGYKDAKSFLEQHAHITWAYAQTTGKEVLAFADKTVMKSIQEIDAQLEMPQISPETKAALRTQKNELIAEYKKGKSYLGDTFENMSENISQETKDMIHRNQTRLDHIFSS